MRSCLLLFVLFLAFSLHLRAQDPGGSNAPAQANGGTQDVPNPAPTTPTPATVAPPSSQQRLSPPAKAQAFQFTKIDLDLLRQVDAFDKVMEEKGWVYNDPDTNAYLEKLGMSLVPKDTPEHVTWRFRAVRDLEVNAFALPNGSIYVNSGLVSRMENEAQLAGVLAHEITHVTNRHGYLEYHSTRKKMVAIDIIVAAASAASYAGVSPALVSAMGNLLPMLVVSTIYGYSRELEHEADVYAVNTLYLQGYNLHEFSRGFVLLRRGPEVDLSKEPVFWASHPKLDERVQYVENMASQLQPATTGLLVDRAGYRAATVNLVRHNAGLAMMLGQPRTAVAIAQRLIADEPTNAENFVLLGDAYRSLGARTPTPDDNELSDSSKNETRKLMGKMTLAEYEKALFAKPQASERWEANVHSSEEAFHKALQLDSTNAAAYRGLGYLDERRDRPVDASAELRKYLELAPNAKDARQIRLHLEGLEKVLPKAASEKPVPVQ